MSGLCGFPNVPRKVLEEPAGGISHAGHLASGLGCLEDPTLCESYQGQRDKFGKFYKADWCVWPSAQLMNFLPLRATPVLSHLHKRPDAGLGHVPFLLEIPDPPSLEAPRLNGRGHCRLS